jgi:hypothetical protein
VGERGGALEPFASLAVEGEDLLPQGFSDGAEVSGAHSEGSVGSVGKTLSEPGIPGLGRSHLRREVVRQEDHAHRWGVKPSASLEAEGRHASHRVRGSRHTPNQGEGMTGNVQYQHAPQMRDYDSEAVAGIWWTPFVMFHCGFPNAETRSVSLDGLGIRHTITADGRRISPETLEGSPEGGAPVSLVVGGSAAFGVGATSDATTVASRLNRMTPRLWLNLGMRSWVLPQNLIHFLFLRPRLPRVERIVLFAGLNELDIYKISNLTTLPYGPFYGWREFFSRMNADFRQHDGAEFLFPTQLGRMAFRLGESEQSREVFLDLLDTCLGGWAMIAREVSAKVVFCIQPTHAWLERASSPEEEEIMEERFQQYPENRKLFADEAAAYRDWYRDTVERLCAAHGFGFLDLNSEFDVPELDRRFLFLDPWHLTDQGSELAARTIAKAV